MTSECSSLPKSTLESSAKVPETIFWSWQPTLATPIAKVESVKAVKVE